MAAPSIKGTAFQSVVEDVCRLREAGRLAEDVLDARLEADDLRLLDAKVLPGLWYPLASYGRLTELLMEVEGGGRVSYVVARGARAAERLFAAGLYQQLARGDEIGARKAASNERWSEQEANLMTSLAGAIFNVSRWRYVIEPGVTGTSRIEVSEAAALPEVSRWAAQGFVEYTSSRLSGVTTRVTSERPSPDRIVFTLRQTPTGDVRRAGDSPAAPSTRKSTT
jgi:hypothetical protein